MLSKLIIKIVLFSAVTTGITNRLQSQTQYLIRFTDKHNSPYQIKQPSDYLSAKSIQRRFKQNISIDSSDLPPNPLYIDSIKHIPGVTFINQSKWLNQILVHVTDSTAINLINNYSFVAWLKKVGNNNYPAINFIPPNNNITRNNIQLTTNTITADTINYGDNAAQIKIHEGNYLHNNGFRGQGMTIAMLDAGYYNYLHNPAFDSLRLQNRVTDEYDFVMNERSVNEDHSHGSICLSVMAANSPGLIVGSAPNANYLLYRTEDVASETLIEEQNWIAGAEKADSIGADLISSSLGYIEFDDSTHTHSYEQRDGNTTMITAAADLAAKKGMIVINAVGNYGSSPTHKKFVMCPADGDSVVAVGMINKDGEIHHNSNWGPNGAGKTKPNIVSVGWNAVYANNNGLPATTNGTSLATPNVAGLIACLWQAFPEFTNMEIIDAVQQSADRYLQPDDQYGYGIPNFRIASTLLHNKREAKLQARLKKSFITAYPVPFKQQFTVFLKAPVTAKVNMRLVSAHGKIIQAKVYNFIKDDYYSIDWFAPQLSAGVYYLQYHDNEGNKKTIHLLAR